MIYKQGKVTFKSIDKDGFFNCSVQGNGNIYSTAIKVEDNIVLQSCNCPVHYTYGKCKHVYATALTYEEYLKQNDEQAIISVNTTNEITTIFSKEYKNQKQSNHSMLIICLL